MNKLVTYFKNWGVHQWVRLFFGLFFMGVMVFYGFHWALLLFGSIFLVMAFMNWGCTGESACSTNYRVSSGGDSPPKKI